MEIFKIQSTPLDYENKTPGTMFVWAANNITACYSACQTDLKVIATNIPSTYNIAPQAVCDDLDINGNNVNNDKRDGIATLFKCNQNDNQNLLPTTTELFTISIIIEIKPMH
jgi:hypothetical protein